VFLQAQVRRGAYSHAAVYGEALLQAVRAVPAIALERARARMRQGRMSDAERAFAVPTSQLDRLASALSSPSKRCHSRIAIWVVVDGGAVYMRSVRGVRGRWYREATAFPEVVLCAGERRLPAQVEPISGPTTIARERGLCA
jgi:hypothetical protein